MNTTSSQKSLLKSTGIMTLATLASRITGLGRTWAMAFALGNTLITSAYQVANNMPNVIYDLIAGGILGTAFLPIYLLEHTNKGEKAADAFASNILNISLVFLGIISIIATLFAPQVISTQTFTISESSEVFSYSVFFFRIFSIQIVFYGLGGVITGVLNARRIYGIPSLAPALNNIVVIASFFIYIPLSYTNQELALIVLAAGTSLGVVAQFAIQLPALRKLGFSYSPRINLKDPALKEALYIAIPTLIYIAGTLISFSCRNAFALNVSDVGPATLMYAWIWYQLPYGVIAVSLSTAYLTEMSTAAARNDIALLRKSVEGGLRTTLCAIIPLAGLMVLFAITIAQIFQAGAFDSLAALQVGDILRIWVISLPFYAGAMFLYRVFASLRHFMTFALVSTGLCVLQIALYALLSQKEFFGLYGLPLADCVYFALQFFIMAFILKKRIGSFGLAGLAVLSGKLVFASLLTIAPLALVLDMLPTSSSSIQALIQLGILGLCGLIITFGICSILKIEELEIIKDLFTRLINRLKKNSTS